MSYYQRNKERILAKQKTPKGREIQNRSSKKYSNKPETKKKKTEQMKKIYELFNNQCESCNEKLDLTQSKINLEIHHKFYSKNDYEYLENHKSLGTKPIIEIENMVINNKNIHEKYTLLCRVCNMIEAWVRQNPTKAKSAFNWLQSQNYFGKIDDT